jgi:hypothetical protein
MVRAVRACTFVLIAAAGAAACKHPRPKTSFSSDPADRRVLGEPIRVWASWGDTCTDWSAEIGTWFDGRDPEDEPDTTEPCAEKPLAVAVTCSTACDVDATDAKGTGKASITVVPRVLGPMALVATSTRMDTGEAHRAELGAVTIVAPDRLQLECAYEPSLYRECGPEGLPADAPFFHAYAILDGEPHESRALTINGIAFRDIVGDQSLATLYPDARVGELGVQPGTYDVELAVGDVTAKWKLVAR